MTSAKPSVSFVVPALNEAAHIEKTLDTIRQAAGRSRAADYQVVFVNDGSTDATGEIMERLAAHNGKIRVVHNPRNLGLGGAYKAGVAAATCDYVMIINGDNIMPASSIVAILERLGEADIILPYMTDARLRAPLRRVGSRCWTLLINLLFGCRGRYYNSMVPRRDLLNRISINTDGYSMQAECIIKLLRRGATFTEIGVPHGHGTVQSSSHALRPRNLANVVWGLCRLVKEIRFGPR